MIKVFQVPVILNEDESFDEMTYQAEGIADYWEVKSKEYRDPQSALDDIKDQLTKQFQKDADTWGEVVIEEERDLQLDDGQKIVTLEISINLDDEE